MKKLFEDEENIIFEIEDYNDIRNLRLLPYEAPSQKKYNECISNGEMMYLVDTKRYKPQSHIKYTFFHKSRKNEIIFLARRDKNMEEDEIEGIYMWMLSSDAIKFIREL